MTQNNNESSLKSIHTLIAEIKAQLRCITIKEALAEIEENNGLMLDVREPEEAKNQPISASLNIPRGILEMKLPEVSNNPDKAIYIHCATSGRASLAAEQLLRLGYTNVSVIGCDASTIANACN